MNRINGERKKTYTYTHTPFEYCFVKHFAKSTKYIHSQCVKKKVVLKYLELTLALKCSKNTYYVNYG